MTGSELKAERKKLGLTQAKFAAELGVSMSAVVAWELGRNPVPARVVQVLAPATLVPGVPDEALPDETMYERLQEEQRHTWFMNPGKIVTRPQQVKKRKEELREAMLANEHPWFMGKSIRELVDIGWLKVKESEWAGGIGIEGRALLDLRTETLEQKEARQIAEQRKLLGMSPGTPPRRE